MANRNLYNISYNFDKFLNDEGLTSQKERIDEIILTHSDKQGSLIPVLQEVQSSIKYLPPVVQDYIAMGLKIPSSDVFGVVSFYSFFSMIPRGENIIRVCLGTACYVKGAGKIVEVMERGLGVKVEEGGTTEDRKFTLDVVRCLGACGLAPVVIINNEDTYGMLEPGKSMDILKKY
ncbi:MAG: NAD(P)H-dependent oxidoreductase subunit E [Spirochaetota bacterium]|nr:NAD(P)H-dependent oxidoreductase subunit E [Spirochaetota bacterium]